MDSRLSYRPDIDGLRAVAVLAVMGFHFWPARLPGGVVGVDVFFVISGFVIGQILLHEIEKTGTINLRNFYWRRFKRLAPGFAVVLALVTFVFNAYLPLSLSQIFNSSVIAAAGGWSNLLFMMQDSYEVQLGEIQPLLHTWSLGIEAQFYLLIPLLFILIRRLGGSRAGPKASAAWILLGTLVACVISWYGFSETVVFYSPATRFWELAVGLMAASARPIMTSGDRASLRRSILVDVALFGLVASFFLLGVLQSGPQLQSAIPVLAAAILVIFGCGGLISRVLSLRPVGYIGRISYLLYLWHWPALMIYPFLFGELTRASKILLFVTVFILSALTYHFVENPIRSGLVPAPIWISGVVSLLAIALVISSLALIRKLPQTAQDMLPRSVVTPQPAMHKPYLIVIGDSYARALGPLKSTADSLGYGFASWAGNGCPFLLGVDKLNFETGEISTECNASTQRERLAWLRKFPKSTVIWAARWPMWESGNQLEDADWKLGLAAEGTYERISTEDFRTALQSTVTMVEDAGHQVLIVYPWPDLGFNLPDEIDSGGEWPLSTPITISSNLWLERSAASTEALDAIEGEKIVRVRADEIFCDFGLNGLCVTHTSSEIYYSDDDHLSHSGALLVAEKIRRAME